MKEKNYFSHQAELNLINAVTTYLLHNKEMGRSLHAFLSEIGEDPTYERWMNAKKIAINAYLAKTPNAKRGARDVFWSRYVKKLREYASETSLKLSIPEKPKSQSEAAIAQRNHRANEFIYKSESELKELIRENSLKIANGKASTNDIKDFSKQINALEKTSKKYTHDILKEKRSLIKEKANTIYKYITHKNEHIAHMFELLMIATSEKSEPDEREMTCDDLIEKLADFKNNLTKLSLEKTKNH